MNLVHYISSHSPLHYSRTQYRLSRREYGLRNSFRLARVCIREPHFHEYHSAFLKPPRPWISKDFHCHPSFGGFLWNSGIRRCLGWSVHCLIIALSRLTCQSTISTQSHKLRSLPDSKWKGWSFGIEKTSIHLGIFLFFPFSSVQFSSV